jgi:hypothetical protein
LRIELHRRHEKALLSGQLGKDTLYGLPFFGIFFTALFRFIKFISCINLQNLGSNENLGRQIGFFG